MGVTFQAQINANDYPEQKVFMTDLYPDLDEAFFHEEGYSPFDDETQRHYQMDRIIDFKHSRDFSYSNFYFLLDLVDRNIRLATQADGGYFSVPHADLQVFRRKVFIALNKVNQEHAVEPSVNGNFYDAGVTVEYIQSALTDMLEIIEQAYKKNLNLFWA
jgi:hypothetical protein